jgi:hypothetical protein
VTEVPASPAATRFHTRLVMPLEVAVPTVCQPAGLLEIVTVLLLIVSISSMPSPG